MDQNSVIERGGFFFIYNFDSGNLGRVERVPTELIAPSVASQKTVPTEIPDFEFNLWTRPDCAGTEFENGNRTWFYFGVQASEPNVLVRLNLINLNKQGKMYAQGMAPVTRTLPGKPQWERIRDRPVHNTDDNTFTLSFKYRTSDNTKATTFFAFTYPFSFAELQIALNSIDMKMLPLPPPQTPDDIYYHRECLIYSLEGRRVDLLTISSHHGITTDREERLKNLFPERHERPFKFQNKKVIFISARVHPGETPSSFVFNGFLNLLLNPNDPIAIQLRKVYVFKMIPFLNPDGVARGHYRTDTRGVNLNRVYLNPSLSLHPTVFASRALIRFYHYGCEKEDSFDDTKSYASRSIQNVSESSEYLDSKKKRLPGGYKGGDYGKRAVQGGDKNIGKAASGNKSITTLKQPSDASKRESSSVYKIGVEAGALADQVYDMSIRESQTSASQPSQPTGTKRKEERTKRSTANERTNGPSLLNEQVLRSCLGSNVHLSNSDELNLSGGNPMRPLRDTLKDSISLLLGSTSSNADTSLAEKEPRLTNVRMGWCAECRANVFKLEHSMPSIGGVVPGFNDSTVNQAEQPGANARIPSDRVSIQTTFSSIDEYRESQQKQFEDAALLKEAQRLEAENALEAEREEGAVYFCTNCFKRYMLTENNEEVLCETVSSVLTTVSAGDSGSIRAAPPGPPPGPAASTGDTLPCSRPSKEERPRNKGGLRKKQSAAKAPPPPPAYKEVESGLYLYLDLHGHASKKGIFMYGNHFEDLESCVECMLLPRIMSLNNLHFHFSSCNFTERNMYLKDRRDGMSREGSGRVAVFKATGLVRSYTLECNYNTGRLVNVLPPTVHEGPGACQLSSSAPLPPKYTPHIFEEVGRSLGASILDLTGQHPNSRIPCSEHRNVTAVREWLRSHTKTMRPQLTIPRVRPKTASPPRVPLYARSKAKVTDERKENAYRGDGERRRADPAPAAPLAPRPAADVVNLNLRVRAPQATPSRSRFLLDESKPKALTAKRRNVLSIRKPNASKTHVGARPAARKTRRGADDAAGSRASLSAKLSKRSFARGAAVPHGGVPRALASSSSEEQLGEAWPLAAPDSLAGRRRPYPRAPATHLKKIRLKAAL